MAAAVGIAALHLYRFYILMDLAAACMHMLQKGRLFWCRWSSQGYSE